MDEEDTAKKKIAMSGATGFVGSCLTEAFDAQNWEVVPLGREDFKGSIEALAQRLEGVEIIVNLAGAPIIERWSEAYKKVLYDSRVAVTEKIIEACSVLEYKPELLISTSAIGYYDSVGKHTEEEFSTANDFLGRLTQDWEQEAMKAKEQGMRVVIFRFGIILGKGGGALKKMLTPFKAGLGGTIGDGSQPFSWIHIKDLIRAYEKVITDSSCDGAYNLTAPNPTTNKGLTLALGKALKKPTVLTVPKFVLRLQLGEGAKVLLQGQTVIPKRLLDSGFEFQFTDIDETVLDCVSSA